MNLAITSKTANIWTSRCKNDKCGQLIGQYNPPNGGSAQSFVHILFPGEVTTCIDPKPAKTPKEG